jgi:hypothetical protein
MPPPPPPASLCFSSSSTASTASPRARGHDLRLSQTSPPNTSTEAGMPTSRIHRTIIIWVSVIDNDADAQARKLRASQ